MFRKLTLGVVVLTTLAAGCRRSSSDDTQRPAENPASFALVGSIDLGNTGASEISAYDPQTRRLFVVNNDVTARVNVVDLSNPASPASSQAINMSSFGLGAVNSVAVSNGRLAIAAEATNPQANGTVLVINTSTLAEVTRITVGAMPDNVVYSPNGQFILTANEGEPNAAYTTDPEGSVSIINVNNNYSVVTLSFAGFASQLPTLAANQFRIYGLNATFAQDVEPEYIAVSDDSRTAWVTLQENNGIARIDLTTNTITNIFPLGFKDYNVAANGIDASDQDGTVALSPRPVRGLPLPDGIGFFSVNNTPYLITANEGDSRAYTGFNEEVRMGNTAYVMNPTLFPNAAALKANASLGRLQSTNTLGRNSNGQYDQLYSYGTRSFSIWNGNTGALVFDPGNAMEQQVISGSNLYDDNRSDDKGVEPEAATVARMGDRIIAFIGLERADAVMVYDVTNPTAPTFLRLLPTADAPEGVLFIDRDQSPTGKSLLVVTCEGDGFTQVFSVQ